MLKIRVFSFLAGIIFMFSTAIAVFAQSATEKNFLSLYFSEEELTVVSATRSLKSIDRIAENISVITHEEIELMNAHTVADVLQKVNGVQVRKLGGPGSYAHLQIQGSDNRHVAVFMDGVPLNMFSDNVTDIAAIPAQIIEKIEVIKGPASSVWGSSLGGVVNIITKSGIDQKRSGGTLYGALGEQTFHDLRAELYGKTEKIGYYLYAGRLGSDGFKGLPDKSNIGLNEFYLKLSHDLGRDSQLVLTTFYASGNRGEGNPPQDWIDKKKIENLFASLTLNTALTKDIKLSLSAHTAMRDWKYTGRVVSSDELYTDYHTKDTAHGFSAKLTSKIQSHALVGGIDYDNGIVHLTDSVWAADNRARTARWAAYFNDTMTYGKLAVTPGIRIDHDNIINTFVSPSLGVTYAVHEKMLLRAFVARGFNTPPALWAEDTIPYGFKGNPDLEPETVWSYQLGLETGALKYVWLKVSAFRHDIKNAVIDKEIVGDPDFFYTMVNGERLRRQGVEAEIRTLPFHHFVFSAGATYQRVKNMADDETVRDHPNLSYDLSIKYDDEKSLKALLTGHYVWWDSVRQGNYRGMLVDFNLMKRIYKQADREAALFFTLRNIFDAEHHVSPPYRYPDRWLEAGIRFTF